MSDDDKDCFNNNKLFINDARFVMSISIYQIKLKLFFIFSIQ